MERRDFIVSTYKHLGVAILAFVVLSAVLMVSGLSTATAKMLMASGNKFIWLGVMGAFMLVGWLASHQARRASSRCWWARSLGQRAAPRRTFPSWAAS